MPDPVNGESANLQEPALGVPTESAGPPERLLCTRFITSTPLDTASGSGTYVGISALAQALRDLGHQVDLVAPRLCLPPYLLRRLLFNESIVRHATGKCDFTVGFDLDGYRLSRGRTVPHVASIKGVLADEMRFERGPSRASLRIQANLERKHVLRADLVIVTSRYSADRIQELYGPERRPAIVPELIDLGAWRNAFARAAARPDPFRFTILTVCHLYPRKRVDLLLRAAARLRHRIPELEVRIVGVGPDARRLQSLSRKLRIEETVRWLGHIPKTELAAEYQRCHLFCLPSSQEGFGIVLLEAMAAGKAIVASKAAAIPEVVPHAALVEPENEEALAEGIDGLYRRPSLRALLGEAGLELVRRYNAPVVARQFLKTVEASLF